MGLRDRFARAFDEKVESVMEDSHDGANGIQDPHWNKGASHEMGKPYSDDLRERVVAAIEAGHTPVKVAELYNMALSTVGGIIKRKRAVLAFLNSDRVQRWVRWLLS
jgi:hypothetical protein